MIRSASFKVFSQKDNNQLACRLLCFARSDTGNSGCGIYVADMSKSEILYMNNYCKQLLSNIIEQNKLENIFFPYCREPELYRGLRDGGGQVV